LNRKLLSTVVGASFEDREEKYVKDDKYKPGLSNASAKAVNGQIMENIEIRERVSSSSTTNVM